MNLERLKQKYDILENFDPRSKQYRVLNFFNLPIALSTCIYKEAILHPSWTCFAGNWDLPFIKGGKFNSILNSFNISLMVNPLSAIIDIPGLSFNVSRKPQFLVSCTSLIEPT